MARVPFTLRIDEKERAALEDLSKIEGRPVNQLLNESIKSFSSTVALENVALRRTSRDSGLTGSVILNFVRLWLRSRNRKRVSTIPWKGSRSKGRPGKQTADPSTPHDKNRHAALGMTGLTESVRNSS
jgi:hypothetical protein